MRYVRAGRSGLELSAIGIGSWPAAAETDQRVTEVLRHAYERGVRFVDTANFYAGGGRERVVGAALRPFPRESYVLATKVSFPIGEPPNNQGLSRKHIREQCDASLRRLGADHIDLYQCHRYEPDTPLGETCRAMDDLVRAGKILYWGMTSWPPEGIAAATALCAARGWELPLSDQEQYSALWRVPETQFGVCAAHGMASTVWSPLAMGVLGGRYQAGDAVPEGSRATRPEGRWMTPFLAPPVLAAVDRARTLAEDGGLSLARLALGWCLSRPHVTALVIGASSTAQVDDSVSAAEDVLDDDLLAAFDALTSPVAIR